MSGSDGFIGWGMKLYRTVGGVPVKMPGLLEATPASPQVDRVDMTHAESPGRRSEERAGMFGPSTFSFKMIKIDNTVDPTNAAIQEALFAIVGNMSNIETWVFEQYSNDPVTPVKQTTETFTAWVLSAKPDSVTVKGQVTMSVELVVTGLPVRT